MAVVFHNNDPKIAGSSAAPRLSMASRSRQRPKNARWGLLFALAVSATMWIVVIGVVVRLIGGA
jgi:hypothetical protein